MKIFACARCGNRVLMLNDSGAPMTCCGETMKELAAGVQDAAREKHVPAVTAQGNVIQVDVGSVTHPMTAEHWIQWILVAQGEHVQAVKLACTDQPKAAFTVAPKPYTVYALCNLHGLWKAD